MPAESTTSSTRSSASTAPALPRNTPAGSRPESRSPSRASSADSTAKLRCTVSTVESNTATQNSPAEAGASTLRSGPRARANGTTWFTATRERISIRRSLPHTRTASRNNDRLRFDPAAGEADGAVGHSRGAGELVGREDDGGARLARLGDDPVEQVAARLVEPGVRLVEQPQAGLPAEQHGDRDPPPLAGGELGDLRGGEAAGDAEALERPAGAHSRLPSGKASRPEGEADVLRAREVVVEERGVPEQADVTAHSAAVRGEVVAEHGRLAGRERDEAGAQTEQARLASPVRALEMDDLALGDVQRHPCEQGEVACEGDRLAEADGGRHVDRPHGTGRAARQAKRPVPPSWPSVPRAPGRRRPSWRRDRGSRPPASSRAPHAPSSRRRRAGRPPRVA